MTCYGLWIQCVKKQAMKATMFSENFDDVLWVVNLHWRFGLGVISAVYRRKNQNVKGCCYESDRFGVAIQANPVAP